MKGKPYSLEISEEAEGDFDNSYAWYYNENPKLAQTFFHDINSSLEKIKRNPFSFPEVFKNLRKYTVKKFPFVIYYQVENYTINVIAIFHTSRNPQIWSKRMND